MQKRQRRKEMKRLEKQFDTLESVMKLWSHILCGKEKKEGIE